MSRARSRKAPRAPPGAKVQAARSITRATTPASPGSRLYRRIEVDEVERRIASQFIDSASFGASNLVEAQVRFAQARTDANGAPSIVPALLKSLAKRKIDAAMTDGRVITFFQG